MVVPTKLALAQEIDNFWHHISNAFITQIHNAKQRIESVVIKSPHQMVMEQMQRLDDLARTLQIIIDAKMAAAKHKMDIVANMPNVLSNTLTTLVQRVEHTGKMLESLSYKNVLNRGYAIARDDAGAIISSTKKVKNIATIEFADGIAKI